MKPQCTMHTVGHEEMFEAPSEVVGIQENLSEVVEE